MTVEQLVDVFRRRRRLSAGRVEVMHGRRTLKNEELGSELGLEDGKRLDVVICG